MMGYISKFYIYL